MLEIFLPSQTRKKFLAYDARKCISSKLLMLEIFMLEKCWSSKMFKLETFDARNVYARKCWSSKIWSSKIWSSKIFVDARNQVMLEIFKQVMLEIKWCSKNVFLNKWCSKSGDARNVLNSKFFNARNLSISFILATNF